MKTFNVTFSIENSGWYTIEENEYVGDLVYTITVKANTWEDSFDKAKEGYYYNTKDTSRLYNFTSEEVC